MGVPAWVGGREGGKEMAALASVGGVSSRGGGGDVRGGGLSSVSGVMADISCFSLDCRNKNFNEKADRDIGKLRAILHGNT